MNDASVSICVEILRDKGGARSIFRLIFLHVRLRMQKHVEHLSENIVFECQLVSIQKCIPNVGQYRWFLENVSGVAGKIGGTLGVHF